MLKKGFYVSLLIIITTTPMQWACLGFLFDNESETNQKEALASEPQSITPTPSPSTTKDAENLSYQNLTIQNLNVLSKTTLSKNTTIVSGPFVVGTKKMVVEPSTGNTTIQGKTTINNELQVNNGSLYIKDGSFFLSTSLPAQPILKASPSILQYSGEQVVFNNSTDQNSFYVAINNKTGQIERHLEEISHLTGQKKISSLDQPLLTLSFLRFLEDVPLNSKGTHVKITCFISGLVDTLQTEAFYQAMLYILPGAFESDPCTTTIIQEHSTTSLGPPIIITSNVTGTGITAVLALAHSHLLEEQTVTFLYEVTSNNLVEVN